MTLKEYLESLVKKQNDYQKIDFEKYEDIANLSKVYIEKEKFDSQYKDIFMLVTNEANSIREIENKINKISDEETRNKLNATLEKAQYDAYKSALHYHESVVLKLSYNIQTDYNQLNKDQLYGRCLQYELNLNELNQKTMEVVKGRISLFLKENPDILINNIGAFIDNEEEFKIKVDECLNNVKIENDFEIHREKEINELINNEKDPELKEAYQYIKDNIFTLRTKEQRDYVTNIIENVPTLIDSNLINKISNQLKNKDIYKDKVVQHGANIVLKDSNADNEDLKDDIMKEGYIFSDETKKILKEGLEYLNSFKTPSGDRMFDIKEFETEEGTKIYGFKNLNLIYNLADSKFTSGNKEDILNIVNLHKENIQKYDHLIDIVKKFDTFFFPSNISLARTENMPKKYGNDYKNTSIVNGLWQCLAVIEESGCTIDEFIDNPMNIVKRNYEKQKNNKDYLKSISPYGDLNFLRIALYRAQDSTITREIIKRTNVFRAYHTLSTLDKNNLEHNYQTFNLVNNVFLGEHAQEKINEHNEFLNSYFIKSKDNDDPYIKTIKNILIVKESDDKDYSILSNNINSKNNNPQAFNYIEYLNSDKVDTDELYNKLMTMKEQINNNEDYQKNGDHKNVGRLVNLAVKEMTDDLILYDKVSIENDNFVNIISNSTLKYDEIIYNSLRGRGDVKEYIINKYQDIKVNSKENNGNKLVEEAVLVKAYKQNYDRNSWFKKIFYKSVRDQRREINNLKNDLISNGMDKDSLDKFLKDKENIDDLREKTGFNYEQAKSIVNVKKELKEDPTVINTNVVSKQVERNKEPNLNKDKGSIV